MAPVIREKAVFNAKGGMPTMRFANLGMGLHSLESLDARLESLSRQADRGRPTGNYAVLR